MSLDSSSTRSQADNATRDVWLYRPAPRQSAFARLFCFPYAGVGASVFRNWPSGLPIEFDLCAVQLPGRTIRISEPAIASIPVLAENIADVITPHLDIPFVFFGHSMGAVLAGEVARELDARGLQLPRHLIVSARRPPHVPDPHPPLRNLTDAEFIDEVIRRYGGIAPEVLAEKDVLAILLPTLRADVAALETYRPPRRAPLQCPISAFGGADDALTPRADLEAWRSETALNFEVSVFPGGHFYLEAEQAAVLAKISTILSPILNAARKREPAQ